jgi:hypothetical protein
MASKLTVQQTYLSCKYISIINFSPFNNYIIFSIKKLKQY